MPRMRHCKLNFKVWVQSAFPREGFQDYNRRQNHDVWDTDLFFSIENKNFINSPPPPYNVALLGYVAPCLCTNTVRGG